MTPEKRAFENHKLEKRLCREVGRAIVSGASSAMRARRPAATSAAKSTPGGSP